MNGNTTHVTDGPKIASKPCHFCSQKSPSLMTWKRVSLFGSTPSRPRQQSCTVSEEAAGLLWLFVLHSRDRIRLWNLSFVRFDSGSFAQKLLEQFLHSPKREVRKKGLRIKQMLRDSRSVKMPREAGHYGRRVAQKRAYNTRTQRDKPFRSREVSS